MSEYTIRVLSLDGQHSIEFVENHNADGEAIKAGRKVAQGLPFEVRRGDKKVYPPGTKPGNRPQGSG